MRDFSWKYFTLTGDVESFMLYKEMDQYGMSALPSDAEGYEEDLAGEESE
ncbi:YqzL family protein [Paenibacillus pinisoli]|uniref:YqzL family protein n=1 Tax=Paenibacillus pinisoli TaxID=1276110 RepID=A0A3A6PWR3_9BACL|nr:YqzL family protein [Paenibacillus pinisoli]RJX38284.1 YqzL family protein [Paenibacillus pinisoli]